jgi:heptosyltransferase-2
LGKSLRAKKYTQAIVLPNSFKSALIPFFAKIPKRTGWVGEMRYFILNDARRLDKKRYPLMIERFMALALAPNESLPAVYPIPALINHQLTVSEKKILVLCPGAEFGPAKRWPENYYADVANQKLNEGWEVWILGSEKDKPVAEKIRELTQNRSVNYAGKTKLEEAVDLLGMATAVVSNDSGLMHIAAALQKPLIAIYGPTSAGFTPPLNSDAKVLTLAIECQPCFQRECPLKHHRCMLDLKPQQVLATLAQLVK